VASTSGDCTSLSKHRERAPIGIEVDVSFAQMPTTVLVGPAETAVKESTRRVERAIVNSGYRRAIDRVVINLAPAQLIIKFMPRPGQLHSDCTKWHHKR
jgi:hypothetical protein